MTVTPRSRRYVMTWVALVALALASFILSKEPPHAWSMPIAMAIGTCKALLILFFFMHIGGYGVSARLAVVTAVGLILLLGGLMIVDVDTRNGPDQETRVLGTVRQATRLDLNRPR